MGRPAMQLLSDITCQMKCYLAWSGAVHVYVQRFDIYQVYARILLQPCQPRMQPFAHQVLTLRGLLPSPVASWCSSCTRPSATPPARRPRRCWSHGPLRLLVGNSQLQS